MLRFGYVPDAFDMCVIIPLIKNVEGNACSIDNCRGITLTPMLSKLYVYVIACFGVLIISRASVLI